MNPEIRRKARMWLVVVFVLGAAVGGVFGYGFAQRSQASAKEPVAGLSEPERRAKRVAEMSKELGLTDEQSAKVDGIIHRTHEEMKAVRDKSEGELDAIRMRGREEIRSLLTPEQKPKFEDLVQRMDAQRKKGQMAK